MCSSDLGRHACAVVGHHYRNVEFAAGAYQHADGALKSSVDSTLHQIDEQISALEGDNGRAGLLSQLQERRAQIQLTSTTGGRVISEAQVPASSSALGPVKMAIVGAVAGLLIGAVLAYGRDRTMRHVGYADRLEAAKIGRASCRERV